MPFYFRILASGLVSIVAVCAVAYFLAISGIIENTPQNSFKAKVVEVCIQFFFVAVAGALIAFWIRQHEQKAATLTREADIIRLEEETRLQIVGAFLEEVRSIYRSVKKIRRMIRALSSQDGVDRQIRFDNLYMLMNQLEDAQLAMEALLDQAEDITIFDIQFDLANPDETRHLLRQAESYIRDALRNFESGEHLNRAADEEIKILHNTNLYSFFESGRNNSTGGTFSPEFAQKMRSIESNIVKSLARSKERNHAKSYGSSSESQ